MPHNRHIAGDALVLLARDWASNTSLNLPMVLCGCVEDNSNVVSIAFVCPYRLCHIANILVVSIEALNNKRAALGVLLRGKSEANIWDRSSSTRIFICILVSVPRTSGNHAP